jgi:hypothetical protein
MIVAAEFMVDGKYPVVIGITDGEEPHAVVTNPNLLGLFGSGWAAVGITVIFGTARL